jgi:hypothetical protein
VCQAGGAIVCNRGCQRVMGMLLATRSIGDFDLRAYGVIPDPELHCYRRCAEDEFMVLASDGLWDVVQCHEACGLVAKVFQRGKCKALSRRATCRWGPGLGRCSRCCFCLAGRRWAVWGGSVLHCAEHAAGGPAGGTMMLYMLLCSPMAEAPAADVQLQIATSRPAECMCLLLHTGWQRTR